MTDSCIYNSSGKPTYYPICLSPQRENFDYKAYFLDASINKKSVITSNIFKNYNEEQTQKQLFERAQEKSKIGRKFPEEKKTDFYSSLSLNKNTISKPDKQQKTATITEDDHNSFDSFTHGFSQKSCVNPNFLIANKYLKERLKSSK